MASHDPSKYRFSTSTYVIMFTTLLTAYYMYVFRVCNSNSSDFFFSWDTSMSQKSRFKMQTQGVFKYRKTFPQLPWGTIKNPTFVQTAHG